MKHGAAGYNRGCRCHECRAAARDRVSRWRVAADAALADENSVPHDLSRYTNYRCRCDECRAAWSEYMRGYRQRRREGAA